MRYVTLSMLLYQIMKLIAILFLSGVLFGSIALIREGLKENQAEFTLTGILVGLAATAYLISTVY